MDGDMICKTAEETMAFAENVARSLPPNSSLALVGDLGSGKTTFIRGLARGFGIGGNVASPSFNVLHVHRGKVLLLHVDAYRLDGSQRARDGLLLDDFLVPPYCLAVEWPELLHGFMDACHYKISIAIGADFSRKITIEKRR
jgi:tRNA threonylcarbamoyladenosine biosynthesis protein TsaE